MLSQYNKKNDKFMRSLLKKKQSRKNEKSRDKFVKKLLFEDALRLSDNNKSGQKTLKTFFQVKKI